jgi:hypothetical protein
MSTSYRRWTRCIKCDARYIAQVKEEVNMGFDSDGHMTHRGSSCAPAEWDRTLELAQRCSRPDDHKCPCLAHTTFPKTLEPAWHRSW